jgi:hypothetical protein
VAGSGLWLQAGVVLLGACAAVEVSDNESSRVYRDVVSDVL